MAERKLFVGTRKGLFLYDVDGDRLSLRSTEFLGVQVPAVCSSLNNDFVIAGLNHGHFGSKMHRSRDGGKTWEEISPPVYPPKPDDVPDIVDPGRNVVVPWSLELIWTIERSSNGTLWCGTIPGGLFRSDDDGDSWHLVESLWNRPERSKWFGGGYDFPGIHSICIHPTDPTRISVGISCGGVWQSNDDGASWECRSTGMRAAYMPPELANDPDVQDPHRMVQCAASPEHYWVQHHNGIFRSDNNCENWTELEEFEPSTFGFAVAVHPTDPNTAWFVPAIKDELRVPKDGRLVVTRTRDGGKTLQTLDKGLPASDAYDLIYRHALEVASDGETLVMGSTTGNLWVSSNGGDEWSRVTHHLPPIFCVRWS